ncbi:hypothetical protein F4810DRAFT_662555 [Camillea tinctor]|nr:hypothetical protein F4810DRAFT_662555 [Camillea tinctor]
MVGYKVVGHKSETKYLRFLASNPNMSFRDNSTNSIIESEDASISQEPYNQLYNRHQNDDEQPFCGRTLKISSQIGTADAATAIFVVRLE